jgi:dTDP-glucose pyrophosphorylase/ubiquinone/menaquinone biosynthesis C-methylase UbiE
MVEIKEKPVLGYVVDYWKDYASDFIFIVGYKKEMIIEYVSQLGIKARFVEQKELHGIADALSYVKDIVSHQFLVVLGDCICHGTFDVPEDMEEGIGVWETKEEGIIRQNYSVEIDQGEVCHVCEKPKVVTTNLCGMGVYVFTTKVFDYIARTPPSSLRNEIEITDVIQTMIEGREHIVPMVFKGDYLNVTFPYDAREAEDIIFRREKQFREYMIMGRRLLLPLFKQFHIVRSWLVGDQLLPFINEGDAVLDFGCGSGLHKMLIARYLASRKNIDLTYIDVVDRDIDKGRFVKYRGGKLPFDDNQFDVVLAVFALHHTENPDFYLREIIRVSRRTILICEDTYTNSMEEAVARFICLSSNFLFGDTTLERHFKPVTEWVDPFVKNGVKLKVFKRIYPHPFPFIPTRNVLIQLEKK